LRSDCIPVSSSESNRRTLNNPLTFLGDVLHYSRLALIEDLAVGEADDVCESRHARVLLSGIHIGD
jgi:hypothetical protein